MVRNKIKCTIFYYNDYSSVYEFVIVNNCFLQLFKKSFKMCNIVILKE